MTAKENIAKCPDTAFGILLSTREVIVLKAGETGYTTLKRPPPGYENCLTPSMQDKFVNALNADDGVTPAERAAMEHGTMFGWETAGARVDNYRKDGTFRKRTFAR